MRIRDRILGPRIGCPCAKCQEAQRKRDKVLLAAARDVLEAVEAVFGEPRDHSVRAWEEFQKLKRELRDAPNRG